MYRHFVHNLKYGKPYKVCLFVCLSICLTDSVLVYIFYFPKNISLQYSRMSSYIAVENQNTIYYNITQKHSQFEWVGRENILYVSSRSL